jgi:hypothetical protein
VCLFSTFAVVFFIAHITYKCALLLSFLAFTLCKLILCGCSGYVFQIIYTCVALFLAFVSADRCGIGFGFIVVCITVFTIIALFLL